MTERALLFDARPAGCDCQWFENQVCDVCQEIDPNNLAPDAKPSSAARDILLRWTLTFVCLAVPNVALMYLPAQWAVGITLICGYELRCVFLAYGEPFQSARDE